MYKRVVVKLSGSLFKYDIAPKRISEFARLFREASKKGLQPILVTGGGEVSRRYASLARSLGSDEASLDEIGLIVAQLNARVLLGSLKELCYPLVPLTLDQVVEAVESGKIVVAGGFHPGQSTNAVAAIIAERIGADLLINATDVDGVYTADPSVNLKAKRFETIGIRKVINLLTDGAMKAGTYELMDLVALKIIERSAIPTRIIKCDVEVLRKALLGDKVGTLITSR